MAESCKGCYHWRGVKDCEYCHYLLDTGFPRNCPADNCLFYKKEFFEMGKGHKISESIRLRVLDQTQSICRAKISPEAPTAMENASEDTIDSGSPADTNIITDVPEVVKQDDYDDYSPYDDVIDEAVIEYSEKIQNKIAEMELHISNYKVVLARLEEYHQKYMEVQNNGT